VPILYYYPMFFALAGFVVSGLLYQHAVAGMQADDKVALIDASSSTRMLTLAAVVVFFALVLWRPVFGWAFLGSAYLALGVRSLFRLRRLNLPPRAARFLLAGNLCAVAGIALCAFIFAFRALP
jgi:ABC-type Fe3+-siderophore transport system permease subunit